MFIITNEVQDNAAVAGPAGGVVEERLAVGQVVERDHWEERRGKLDEVAGVGVGIPEAEYGGEGLVVWVALDGVCAMEKAREEEEEEGGDGEGNLHGLAAAEPETIAARQKRAA